MSHRIGITGGIGSGKSVVARILKTLEIPVYDSDTRARQLMTTDRVIRDQLIALLGPESYFPGGQLNKPFLARFLFSSQENADCINAIVHPRVRMDFSEWALKKNSQKIIALESALLFEAGLENEVDRIWLVTAPWEVRLQRTVNRDGMTGEQVQARIARQRPPEELEKRADVVLRNNGEAALFPQIMSALSEWECGVQR